MTLYNKMADAEEILCQLRDKVKESEVFKRLVTEFKAGRIKPIDPFDRYESVWLVSACTSFKSIQVSVKHSEVDWQPRSNNVYTFVIPEELFDNFTEKAFGTYLAELQAMQRDDIKWHINRYRRELAAYEKACK